MTRKRLSLLVGMSLAATLLNPVNALADTTPESCTNPGFEITGGSLKWGVKTSWRNYIKGKIAAGTWTTEGAITDNGAENTGADFQHIFTVDPKSSHIEGTKDAEGNVKITSAVIKTQDATIKYTGHHGALDSTMISPYLEVKDSTAKVGSTYVGYYVKGKGMTEYTDADRTPENRREGTDTFTKGTINNWKLDGDTLSASTEGLVYTTNPDTDKEQGILKGADIIFMGQYPLNPSKPEPFDNANVELKVKQVCHEPGSSTLDTGSIVGIVIGAIVGLIGLIAAGIAALNPGLLRHFKF